MLNDDIYSCGGSDTKLRSRCRFDCFLQRTNVTYLEEKVLVVFTSRSVTFTHKHVALTKMQQLIHKYREDTVREANQFTKPGNLVTSFPKEDMISKTRQNLPIPTFHPAAICGC